MKFGANDKGIASTECSRNCQVGIDVMSFALNKEPLNSENSSCIGCGICVSVCPMDTLSFGSETTGPVVQIQMKPRPPEQTEPTAPVHA